MTIRYRERKGGFVGVAVAGKWRFRGRVVRTPVRERQRFCSVDERGGRRRVKCGRFQ